MGMCWSLQEQAQPIYKNGKTASHINQKEFIFSEHKDKTINFRSTRILKNSVDNCLKYIMHTSDELIEAQILSCQLRNDSSFKKIRSS